MKRNFFQPLKGIFITTLFLTFLAQLLLAQETPEHFRKEVSEIIENTPVPEDKNAVFLFTGSSSIRLWKDLNAYFPEFTIINTGFGGSQTHELLYYSDELIFRYHPQKIFIYEGDNDLASGKKPTTVLGTMKKLTDKISKTLPEAEIVFLSPKPSPARWHLKDKYEELNQLLEQYCKQTAKVSFINLWDILLDADGEPMEDIFLGDQLHLNKKGYDLWAESIKELLP
ncbi:SGNH/GDSL hydrolase family protein [Echinicola sediminis]